MMEFIFVSAAVWALWLLLEKYVLKQLWQQYAAWAVANISLLVLTGSWVFLPLSILSLWLLYNELGGGRMVKRVYHVTVRTVWWREDED